LDVYDPSGRWLFAQRQVLVSRSTAATAEVPIAFNAPPGRWRLMVRDVVTGVQTERTVVIR
jgi:hypothetical protein